VLQALAAHCEAPEVEDAGAPVRCCHRYLSGRRAQLDYARALADGLPIGSGEIESAAYMLALRIVRINGNWEACWRDLARNAPANDNSSRRTDKRVALTLDFGSHPASTQGFASPAATR
jgi:hypothetical protein